MREIKCRAWDKVLEEYLYSDKFPSMWQFFKELENRGIRHFDTEWYTGLKDKSNKDVYEGDHLTADRWFPCFEGTPPHREKKQVKGYVYWDDEAFGYDLKAQDTEYCLFDLIDPEITGNTHEKPEPF